MKKNLSAGSGKMKELLVVVDYQNDFVCGTLGFVGAADLDARIAAKIADYRARGGAVAFTLDTHGAQYAATQEGRNLPVPHCLRGSEGWALFGETGRGKLPCDVVFEKPAFGSLELAQWLPAQHFTRVELCGLVSYICVVSNAILAKAALPEAEIVVDATCTAGADAALHTAVLSLMEALQITILGRDREDLYA